MSKQFLDDLNIRATRFEQRRVGPAEGTPADLLFYPEPLCCRNQMPYPEHVRPVRFPSFLQMGRENPVAVIAVGIC